MDLPPLSCPVTIRLLGMGRLLLKSAHRLMALLFSGFRFVQQAGDGVVALCRGEGQRGLAAFVFRFGVGALVDEEFDDGFGSASGNGDVERRIARIVRCANIETERHQKPDGFHRFFVAPLIVGRRGGTAITPTQSGGEPHRVGAIRHGEFWIRSSGNQRAHHFNVAGLCGAKERRRAFAQCGIAGRVMAFQNGLFQTAVGIRSMFEQLASTGVRARSWLPAPRPVA